MKKIRVRKRTNLKRRVSVLCLTLTIIFISTLFGLLVGIPYYTRIVYQREIATAEVAALDLAEKQTEIIKNKRQEESFYLPILLYHYVEIVTDERDTIRQSLAISPQTFEAQIISLQKAGYTFITFTDVSDYFSNKKTLPEKPVILSFDDGYRDFYTDVLPILKRYNVQAALFMVSGFIDYTHNYLTSAQLQEIAASPYVEVNAHSVSHPNLTLITAAKARKEIFESKTQLEKFLGKPVEHFAFPYGSHNQQVAELAKAAGFQTASTVDLGVTQSYEDRFILKRIRPGRAVGPDLIYKIQKP